MKNTKTDAAIFHEVLSDIDKSIATLQSYRNESNHKRSVEFEKMYLRCKEIVTKRLNEELKTNHFSRR